MFEESEIPSCLWSSFPNFYQSKFALNFSAVQAINSKDDVVVTETNDSVGQPVDSENEEEEDVSNSELRSDSYLIYMNEQLSPLDSGLEHEITK